MARVCREALKDCRQAKLTESTLDMFLSVNTGGADTVEIYAIVLYIGAHVVRGGSYVLDPTRCHIDSPHALLPVTTAKDQIVKVCRMLLKLTFLKRIRTLSSRDCTCAFVFRLFRTNKGILAAP